MLLQYIPCTRRLYAKHPTYEVRKLKMSIQKQEACSIGIEKNQENHLWLSSAAASVQ